MTTKAIEQLQTLRSYLQGLPPEQTIQAEGLLKVLDEWGLDQQHAEVTAQIGDLQREKAQEIHFKMMAMMIDKGSAYSNLIIIAGYASFFALTPLVKDLLTSAERRWSTILMLVSLAAFVGFEIFKMLFMQHSMMWRYKDFAKATKQPGFDYVAQSEALEKDFNRLQIRFMPAWLGLTTVAVLTGLAAFLIVGSAFVMEVLRT